MSYTIKAPQQLPSYCNGLFRIFLAGSIDQGSARDWQQDVSDLLSDYNVVLLNPRRDMWDSTLKQSITNSEFLKQVTWEQRHLAEAEYRIFVMTDSSKSPITLLELGQHIKDPGVICCEKGFYRAANVEITAKLNNMPYFTNIEDLINHVKVILDGKGLRES